VKLLKRNTLNGKTEEVDSYDAFDQVTTNNFGSLQKDWNINNFDEFVDAFKKDKELEISYGEWSFSNIIKGEEVEVAKEVKKTHEDFILELWEGDLNKYMGHLVDIAEDVLREMKDYQRKIYDEDYVKSPGKEKIIQWAINQAQQVSWHFDEGADVIAKYAVAKTAKEFAEKRNEDQKLIDCLQESLKELQEKQG